MDSLKLTIRQRSILYAIQNRTSYVTSRELAESLKVSGRTIRNDIGDMNRILKKYDAGIESTNGKGFLFFAKDPALIRRLSRIDTAFFSRNERIRYLAFRLCQSGEPLNLYDLEDEIFVSHTALMSDIRAMRKRFSYAQPYIRITIKKDALSLEDNELKIRSLILMLFHEDWDYEIGANAFYGLHLIDEELLMLLRKCTPGILFRHGIILDDPTLTALELTLAIMHFRCVSGHPFPAENAGSDAASPESTAARELLELMEEETGFRFPPDETARITEFISTTRLSPASPVPAPVIRNQDRQDISRKVSGYLHKIKQTFGLDFSEDAEFVQVLHTCFAQLAAGSSIFFTYRKPEKIKSPLSAEYELAQLFQHLAPDYVGRFLTDDELCSLAVCISGAIRHYLEIHPEKKMRAVLFSHRSMAAAWGLKRQLLEMLNPYIDICSILPSNFMERYEFSETDLVLSTVSLPYARQELPEMILIDDLAPGQAAGCEARIKLLSQQKLWPAPSITPARLLKNSWWHEDCSWEEPFEIIEKLAADFIDSRIAAEKHRLDIIQRETRTSFAIRPGIVFLHTILPAEETRLSIMTAAHSIRWNDFKISCVVMGMFRREDLNLLFHLKIRFCNEPFDLSDLMYYRNR